jgi:phosphoribosylformimino-5-aminoimidazole carboxamide ribonucleotide (ProFAR) isomerase
VRVVGGIRTAAQAERILGWGAEKIIIGSAAFRRGEINHRFLRQLAARVGRRRIILALDEGGRIVVRGWRTKLRLKPQDVMRALEPYASEFLSTYVDTERTLRGTNLAWFRALRFAVSRHAPADHRGGRNLQPARSPRARADAHARSRRHGALSRNARLSPPQQAKPN